MEISEGASSAEDKRRRVFFWFVCSALGGVCARDMIQTEEEIVEETYNIATAMTKHWLEHYGVETE